MTLTETASTTGAIKWHPGHYAWYVPGAVNGVSGYRIDLATHRDSILTFIDSIANEPTIKGIQVAVYWRALEGNTAGDYSAGFAALDALLARCAKYNKRLMISFQPVVFGNYAAITDVFPAYLVNGSNYGISNLNPGTGAAARVWQSATMDRLIALTQAYGARYNGHANFEMFSSGETALQIVESGFSNQALLTQLQRFIPAARAAFPNTALRIEANHLDPDSLMTSLYASCAKYACSIGGPDIWPADVTQADRVFAGLDSNHKSVYIDYREQMPWTAEAQWQSFSGNWTIAQLYNATVNGYTATDGSWNGYVMPSMKTKYIVWYANESNLAGGTSALLWRTGIIPFIRSINGAVYSNDCPTSYSSGCNSN
ncbi:MAG: hypothetical protein AB7T07_05085 [Steroidobacteraceae bacterium]